MSLNRYAKKRDANEAEIVELFRKAGLEVHLLDRPVDLLVGFPAEWVLIEVKSEGGTLTHDQREFFKKESPPRYVVRTLEDAQDVIRNHRTW